MKNAKSFLISGSFLWGLTMASGLLCSSSATAGQESFGAGSPASFETLPAGEFRKSLQSISGPAQATALTWLQNIEFTTGDLPYLNVDPQGGVYYTDRFVSTDKSQPSKAGIPESKHLSKDAVFRLHSSPGAERVIFVDFDGGIVRDTAWNDNAGVSSWKTRAYDLDGKPRSFSPAEISAMAEIWHRIAQHFAPFAVDVTTEDPGEFGPNTAWILVTHSEARGRNSLPAPKASGVAYVNTFGFSRTAYYLPALVYYNNLTSPATIARAAAHEMGHIIGLTHDGKTGSGDYYGGAVSWAPIMGLEQEHRVTQWSNGEYRGATNTQDDIQLLSGRMGFRGDDHDDSRFGSATALVVDAQGRISGGGSAIDLLNLRAANSGVIENRDDTDAFVFKTGPGKVDITVSPAWKAYQESSRQGLNIDIQVTLYDAAGKRIARSDPRDNTAARVKARVAGGRYILEVKGTGNPGSYSDYGSLGQYFISGSVPPSHSGSVARKD